MRFNLFALLFLVSSVVAEPQPPPFTFLYGVDLTSGGSRPPGISPVGNRTAVIHSGGVFEGPKLSGSVFIGLDWGIVDLKGAFREDTVYILTTHDGANIWVRAHGITGNVTHFFETGDERYYWLNSVVAYATGGRLKNDTWSGVHLDVWQLG